MSIVNSVVVPHPPIIIPDVGQGNEVKISDTITAYRRAAEFIRDADPDTVIITTPHTVMYYDYFHISPGSGADGDFRDFGAPQVQIHVGYDEELVQNLCEDADQISFPAGTLGEKNPKLDHGFMIPVYFLKEAYGDKPLPKFVRIGLSGRTLAEHYYFGMLIRDVVEYMGRKVSFIASGDLAHRLLKEGPYGFNPSAPEYDAKVMDVLAGADFGKLMTFSDGFCTEAGECGHRSFTIMAGCFDKRDVTAEKLSYQGPFGVGYGVCLFTPGAEDPERNFMEQETAREIQAINDARENQDAYAALARTAVETYIYAGRAARIPDDLPDEMTEKKAGVFVTLNINGKLRGCIGTIEPVTDCIAQEIINNGVSACSRDPRFVKVTKEELPFIQYSVDVLGAPEDVASEDELDEKRYGVIVSSGSKQGLLLPDLEGVDSVKRQIEIAKQKAGIGEGEEYTLRRFEVVRHV
ncbi:MAG: AmmeMemoRadiSam system protein A [Anaerovoracaceae bacterium]|nr:AmmeMemoRadiSam system protein A [Bacillota bacterium]MDY2670868.1 AmmeMemoRadiSam system protein A [Anaerovoracaceae bacterium]